MSMRSSLCGLLTLVILTINQSLAAEPLTLRLWEGDAPNALGSDEKDIPNVIVYRPDTTSSAALPALVICPGGGYGGLAMDHEGHQIAKWANGLGMVGVICQYRHRGRGYGHPNPLLDAQRALRLTRSHAEDWNINPKQVGILGFSAGGHLTSTVLTHFDAGNPQATDPIDRLSCRPDFGVLCYAVIALGEKFTHGGSQKNLLGTDAVPELIASFSNEKQVTADTPPTFLWSTAEDKVVPVENSLRFTSALVANGVQCELHVFPFGRHGLGLAADTPGADQWPTLCQHWLKRLHVLSE